VGEYRYGGTARTTPRQIDFNRQVGLIGIYYWWEYGRFY
jgi:hypothetical protein